ncbi:MAG TPA: tetratricopeptide repeat protein [Chloroflexota bacterium]|jgi:tetratricopeptide (TPR) repeat protein
MAIFQSEDKLRAKRQKVEKAINLAMQNRWSEAVELNRELIEEYPGEVDGHNRLGKALLELGRYAEARDAYAESLRVDPMNTIAQKNHARLTKLAEEEEGADTATAAPTPVDPSLFIEETGKTTQTALVDLAPADVLARMTAGDPLTLEIQGSAVRVFGPAGELLGKLEPKLGQRVINLMTQGNKYSAAVTAVDDHSLRLILRETYRDPSMGDRPSFPAATTEAFRAYTRETVIRYDLDDEDDDGLDDAEVEPDASGESEIDADASMDEPEFIEEP